MKILLTILVALTTQAISFAQPSKDTLPRYITNPTIPPFSILIADSTSFTKSDLPKGKPIVIVWFSPDCSHCQNKARQITENIDSFSNAFFLWISYKPLPEIKDFSIKYGLDTLANFKLGRDTRYFFPSYYKIRGTPYLAVYKPTGLYKQEFRDGVKWQDLAEAVK